MDEERTKKVEAGREKLAAYKRKKQKLGRRTSDDVTPSHSSDSSLSLGLSDLPDNTPSEEGQEPISIASTVSEHLHSSAGSVEQDRSCQEIELSNFSLILQNLPQDEELDISQENKPSTIDASFKSDTLNISDKLSVATDTVQSILNEILRSKFFKSQSENCDKSDSCDTNELSLNIFEGVSLDDSSINNYGSKNRNINVDIGYDERLNVQNPLNDDLIETVDVNNVRSDSDVNVKKIKVLEEELVRKDSVIAALNVELDSVKELTSNQSTYSLNTSTTEYKQFHEDYQNKIAEFQNVFAFKDSLINKLEESIQQLLLNREELQFQSESFAKEISQLQTQLMETSNIIKQHKCFDPPQLKDTMDGNPSGVSVRQENILAEETPLNLENECSKLEDALSVNQIMLLNDLKVKINMHLQQKINDMKSLQDCEVKILKDKLESEKIEHEIEVCRLRELLTSVKCGSTEILELRNELDAKHAREMEELRTYFEKKCADLEKHYSEEIFSQQSRKMSNSSSCSEAELNSEMTYPIKQPPSGPGGDTAPINFKSEPISFKNLSTDDLIELARNLIELSKGLCRYDLENASKDELNALRSELTRHDFSKLYGLAKSNVQKYQAELKLLREDYNSRINSLNADHENQLMSMKQIHREQVDGLKYELNEALHTVQMNVSSAVQEVASSGEYELAEVVQSYERRLQEQVTLAKLDIISALEHKIQMLAASADDSEWPQELLQIRNRFAEKYEAQIADIRNRHDREVAHLKEEHMKILNGALERARRRSLRDNEGPNQGELKIMKERDALRKTNSTLRNLLGELLKYFTQCEDELNNTLVGEIIKHGFDKNLTQIEDELNEPNLSVSSMPDLNPGIKRVHFTPNFSDFINIIDNSGSESPDLSMDFKNELGSCLARLRTDANAVLALSTNARDSAKTPSEATDMLEERISSLTRQIITDSQIKNDLVTRLDEAKNYVQNMESERVSLENHVEQLIAKQKVMECDLMTANKKIADLIECGHKEIVSEGFGQNDGSLGDNVATLAELQERARTLVTDWKNGADHPLIQLVEELCREGERLTEEARKDRVDLKQQIDAADKKLRATCHFLEEQAVEREQERDEAQKEILAVREQLKERDKERATCELVGKEVEQLEQQMREMTKMMEINEQKQQEVENERKEAVDKIWVLRDIIRDLESQVEAKTETEIELKGVISELQDVIKQLNRTNEELGRQLEAYRDCPDLDQLRDRVVYLESEAHRLRLNSELIGSEGALKEIQSQLHDFETTIDKRTRDLEGLHSTISSTSCSSPSEDMSIRDQIRPHTPNSSVDDCDVPLQQLARLKEKLVKHSRAEDAAVKRIRDLEMQLVSTKHDLEETQNEKEILQNQVTEQIVLLSSLQMRLDEQRLRAEHVQKQANTSLEVRIYDLETELQSLKETIHSRDKTVKQLNRVIEETRARLEDRERELSAKVEDKTISDLRQEIERLSEENRLLKVKIDSDAQNAQLLPGLVDNIIADKNSDIEKLRDTLSETQRHLDTFLSLNLDHEQLKQLSQLRSSDRALSDILSLVDLDGSHQMRKMESRAESLNSPVNLFYKRNPNETAFVGGKSIEISCIEKIGPSLNLSPPLTKPNSTEIHKSVDKRVHFEDLDLENQLSELKDQIIQKDKTIDELSEQLKVLNELQNTVENLQKNLQHTEDVLKQTTVTFESEQRKAEEIEKTLRVEIAEKKMHLMEKERGLELSQQDCERKDKMYVSLAKDKRALELKISELEDNLAHYGNFDAMMVEKNKEIYRLEEQLSKLLESRVAIEELETKLKDKEGELLEFEKKFDKLSHEFDDKTKEYVKLGELLTEKDDMNAKLSKDVANKSNQLDSISREVERLKGEINMKNDEIEAIKQGKDEEIKKLQNLLVDRECEIEILNENNTRYQHEFNKLEETKNEDSQLRLMKNRKELAQKDLEIVKLKTAQDDLNKEVIHLQDYLKEKDRIIDQMKADIKSLHVNLETIQNKIQETGNIVDLRKRLLEEQHVNAVLQEELHNLKALDRKDRSISLEDITGQVQKQLDYSAHLDSNILQALSSGDEFNENDLKETLKKEQSLNAELSKANSDLQNILQHLHGKLEAAATQITQLEDLLNQERLNSNTIQIEDAKLIEQMRIKLESALENENEFGTILEKERMTRQNLELQFAALKAKANLSTSSNSKTELTEYKSLPVLESQELKQLRENVMTLKEENDRFKVDNKALKRAKNEQDSVMKYTKDMLELKTAELTKLEERIEQMRLNEIDVREQFVECKTELAQRNREVENSRTLMAELEHERVEMKKEIMSLSDKVRELNEEKQLVDFAQRETQRDANMSSPVPDKFLHKMKELSNLLKENMNENKIMTDTLAKLTDERSTLQEKIRALEQQNNYKMPDDDPVARAKHILGRYLRSESYRKSLIWQKRYLIALLVTYQNFRPITDRLPLGNFEPKNKKVFRSHGINRFRSVVLAVIAIVRVRFLVQRWHSGKRMGAHLHLQQYKNILVTRSNHNINMQSTQFQLGQPVSSTNFSNTQRNLFRSSSCDLHNLNQGNEIPGTSRIGDEMAHRHQRTPTKGSECFTPWTGVTPPGKEPVCVSPHILEITSPNENLPPLQAPQLLAHYVKRFNDIQQRLGMTIENLNS